MFDDAWMFPEALIDYVEQDNVVPMKVFQGTSGEIPALPDGFKPWNCKAVEGTEL